MITLFCAFFIFMLLFAVVGALRGPAKEVLVSFSVLVAIAFIVLVEDLLPLTVNLIQDGSMTQYWFRTLTVLLLVIFGYVTPKISSLSKVAGRQRRISDFLLSRKYAKRAKEHWMQSQERPPCTAPFEVVRSMAFRAHNLTISLGGLCVLTRGIFSDRG